MSEAYNSYITCTKTLCGTFSKDQDPDDPGKKQDYRFPAEKHSNYLAEFVLSLGHRTIIRYQTKVFEVGRFTNARSINSTRTILCSPNEVGVVTTFMISRLQECSRETLKNSNIKKVFLSVEQGE